jgi:hypothetical protein
MDYRNIYEEYRNTLSNLHDLQEAYRIAAEEPQTRAGIHTRIIECQAKLNQIIKDMIHSNPFLNTKRTGQGVLNE